QYIQESSRLGWRKPGPVTVGGDGSPGYECYGWTDVRDGGIGPRGPRDATTGFLPVPNWWSGGSYPDDRVVDPSKSPNNEFTYNETNLPGAGGRRWPCPGSATRCDMYVMKVPPCAVQLLKCPNAIEAIPGDDPTPLIDGPYNLGNHYYHKWQYDGGGGPSGEPATPGGVANVPSGNCSTAWAPYLDQAWTKGHHALDPQPVMDTWTDFRAGDPSPRPSSTAMAWFRVYRELPSDHDNDGKPWWDHIPIKSHSAFVITAGSGGSRGFRFWNAGDAGYSADLEPVTAQASGLFPDEAIFRQLLASERILWYRVEWTANFGGGADAAEHFGANQYDNGPFTFTANYPTSEHQEPAISNQVASYFGAIKWVQRLEKDPVTW
ncbi:MAG: hypothetical protein H0W83_05365, partial [Planctomycetes bacterium]|nr:hypothetical protein [Planctomycetota bacterium]